MSSPTPTVNPTTADYSSHFDKEYTKGNFIMAQPFAKSTNSRGNDVYQGIQKNVTSGSQYTEVLELTQSRTVTKQLFDQTVAQKTNDGFVYQSDLTASQKAGCNCEDMWVGLRQGQYVTIWYYYDSAPSWVLRTTTSI
jgi:hypothetical protein